MTAPTFDGTFVHRWTAEILHNRPMILPRRHYVYPVDAEEVEKGALEVLVLPDSVQPEGIRAENAEPFLATCALGFRDPAAATGLWSCPDPDWICAVAGGYAYLIDVAEPSRFTMIRYRPVLDVFVYRPDDRQSASGPPHVAWAGLLLFVGHHSILAWGAEGEAWESDRLSAEGITNFRIEVCSDGLVLYGEGWDMHTDRQLPFALDLTTGRRL